LQAVTAAARTEGLAAAALTAGRLLQRAACEATRCAHNRGIKQTYLTGASINISTCAVSAMANARYLGMLWALPPSEVIMLALPRLDFSAVALRTAVARRASRGGRGSA